MSVEIVKINGQSQFIDYSKLESTLKDTIGRRCSDAQVFVYNNFPVSISAESNTDLILVIAINPMAGNYYRYKKNDRWVYLRNLIIPIKFVTHLRNEKLKFEDDQILIDDELIDYTNEITSLRFSLIDYLSKRCSFSGEALYIHPLIFIENENHFVMDNYLISDSFDFKSLNLYLQKCSADILLSYKGWNTNDGYEKIVEDISVITEQASKDSEVGYLTKRKIDRLAKKLSSSKKIYDELNSNLVIISGKAGTGKSSELLLLALKSIENSKNILFLTYNKLLVYDLSKTIKSYRNSFEVAEEHKKIGESTILTLHSFFYRLSKSLGVLHVLSSKRITELLTILKERMRSSYDFLSKAVDFENLDFEKLKTSVQNEKSLDTGTKEVCIGLLNFLKRKDAKTNLEFRKLSKEFYEHKRALLENTETNEMFLADYYGVLENTLLAIEKPDEFYRKYNIEDKYDLLEHALNLKEKHTEVINDERKFKESSFISQKSKRVSARRRKRTLFIDEAQDCHRLEKDILVSIYGSNNIVVANGGKEQLIRHVELCNWEVSQAKKLNVKKHYTRNTSYRVKKTIVDFSNFIANKYKIDLNLEPLETEDEGELIVEFTNRHTENDVQEIFDHLSIKGAVHGCSPYERLLVLLDSNSQRTGEILGDSKEVAVINEYGNIEESHQFERGDWIFKKSLEKNNCLLWDGTIGDKFRLVTPSNQESRVIYYESCRGLEAWSVACFSIDKFFDQKREDPDAELYLIEDLFLNQDNEQRKSMYAATWALMAITRVIDTLYIQINDRGSEFGKLVEEYLNTHPRNVREINFTEQIL